MIMDGYMNLWVYIGTLDTVGLETLYGYGSAAFMVMSFDDGGYRDDCTCMPAQIRFTSLYTSSLMVE